MFYLLNIPLKSSLWKENKNNRSQVIIDYNEGKSFIVSDEMTAYSSSKKKRQVKP